MRASWVFALVFAALATLLVNTPARADGIIIPDPPICRWDECPPPPCPGPIRCPPPTPMVQLAIRFHQVQVRIEDQVAVTRVEQVFYNPNDFAVEGTYIFPIPPEAAVSGFQLWVDGEPVEGKVLDAGEARRIYEEIVSQMRDPALLEYSDRGAVQARIFPIEPDGERRVALEYSQVLAAENGLVQYVYPLSTEKFSLWPLESVSISVEIVSSQSSIRAVYSPSHKIAVDRQGAGRVQAGYEDANVLPDTDFALYYSLGEQPAIHLLSYRDPLADEDGYFLLMLAPPVETETTAQPKDLILVLDRSGSMEGEKFRQAQDALRYILPHLNSEDRFSLIAFSTGLEPYSSRLAPAAEAAEALAWVDRLSAEGSTDINRALLEAAALVDGERPAYLIFLTDGLPTTGETEPQAILDNLASQAPDNLRLFAFGVGYDVDTFLLDSLAETHHGKSTYVQPGERLDEILSTFYAQISAPVLTSLSLDFGALTVYDLYPDPLSDLFAGSQIILAGRYRQGGQATLLLRGERDGEEVTYRFDGQRFASESEFSTSLTNIPRLWAARKIGYLLNQIRLHGPDPEIIDQVVRLSLRYGIVTPYTSYLVTEKAPLGAAAQEEAIEQAQKTFEAMSAAPAYGEQAVQRAAQEGALADTDTVAAPAIEAAQSLRFASGRTFVLDENVWTDTAFDPQTMQPVPVAFLSPDYFDLIAARPDLAAAFALGPRVIALAGDTAYEVVASEESVPPLTLPTPIAVQSDDTPMPGNVTPQPASTQPLTNLPSGETADTGGGLCGAALLPLALVGLAWQGRRGSRRSAR